MREHIFTHTYLVLSPVACKCFQKELGLQVAGLAPCPALPGHGAPLGNGIPRCPGFASEAFPLPRAAPVRGWGSRCLPRALCGPRAQRRALRAGTGVGTGARALPRARREYVRWREGDLSPSTFPWG